MTLKRDKEMERLFKKEFHSLESHYDELYKLFKRRTVDLDDAVIQTMNVELNPFADIEKSLITLKNTPSPLNEMRDLPQGLGSDVWNKLIDFRDKKIAIEQQVHITNKHFNEMQTLVQNVLEESDRIRIETEKTSNELSQFMEYKFQNAYNLEILLALKQGQVCYNFMINPASLY